jgi:hypothetical protein
MLHPIVSCGPGLQLLHMQGLQVICRNAELPAPLTGLSSLHMLHLHPQTTDYTCLCTTAMSQVTGGVLPL